MTFKPEVIYVPYEVWARQLLLSGMSWEEFYKTIPEGVVLLPYQSV